MKGYVCLFLLLVGTTLFAQSNATPEEAAVLGVQRQWLEASQKGDGEALRQIIDDSFVGSTPDITSSTSKASFHRLAVSQCSAILSSPALMQRLLAIPPSSSER